MKRIYLAGALGSLLLPLAAFAAYNDVSITQDTGVTFSINGVSLVVSASTGSSVAERVVANSDTLVVRLSPGSAFTISSSDRKALAHDAATVYVASSACTSELSRVKFTYPDSHSGPSTVDITVTPSSSTCTGGASSSGSSEGGVVGSVSSGGGGGGGGSTSTVAPVSPAATQTQTPAVTPSASGVATSFAANLKPGSSNAADVRRLQQLLASDAALYPEGRVTGTYGPLTQKAVERFQTKYGIVSSGTPETTGFGALGPKTRAKISEVFGTSAATGSTGSAATTAIQVQIDALNAQVAELLKQLKALTGN